MKYFVSPMAISAIFAGLLLMGCGDGRPTRVPVAGQVLIDGVPLKYGFVRFIPDGARPSSGKLDENGRFALTSFDDADGAVLGLHRVEVSAGECLSASKTHWHAPKKYNDFGSSGLQQKIEGPTNSVLIELSWDGGKPFVETTATEFPIAGQK